MTSEAIKGFKFFTEKEFTSTGAKIKDIDLASATLLDTFRMKLGKKVFLLKNGITTGQHKCEWHPKGQAFDFYTDGASTETIIETAITCMFRGIGVYYNAESRLHTYHVDTRPVCSLWSGYKAHTKDEWSYGTLIKDIT